MEQQQIWQHVPRRVYSGHGRQRPDHTHGLTCDEGSGGMLLQVKKIYLFLPY